MTLQYLEALKALGASPSTKYVLPLELTGWPQQVGDFVDRTFDDDAPRSGGGPRAAGPGSSPDAPSMGTTGGLRVDPPRATRTAVSARPRSRRRPAAERHPRRAHRADARPETR